MPRRHRLAGQTQIRLDDLPDETFIVHDLPHSREYFAPVFGAAGVDPIVGHRTSSFELVRGLVANGHGGARRAVDSRRPHADQHPARARRHPGDRLACCSAAQSSSAKARTGMDVAR